MIRRFQYKAHGWKKMQVENGSNMEKVVNPQAYKHEHE
jgi:hypothetical protein